MTNTLLTEGNSILKAFLFPGTKILSQETYECEKALFKVHKSSPMASLAFRVKTIVLIVILLYITLYYNEINKFVMVFAQKLCNKIKNRFCKYKLILVI